MSSSADEFGWSAFTPRPTGPPVTELLSPAQELTAVLQAREHDLLAERAAGRQAVEQVLTIVADQVALVFQLGVVVAQCAQRLHDAGMTDVHRRFSIVHRQLTDSLRESGLEIVDPVGWSFDEAEAHVAVTEWRYSAEFTGEVVAETTAPIVRHNGTVIRDGRVIMGAPEEDKERA